MNLWPHQQRGLDQVKDAMNREIRRILFTSPTGGGKSRVMVELLRMGFRSVVYSHRKLLREQLEGVLTDAGLRFGIRAAGVDPALLRDIQLSSLQTENSWVLNQQKRSLHDAQLVLIDEAHDNKAEVASEIIDRHVQAGATVVGFTATPLDLGGLYDELVVAGNNTELRECGALLPCTVYAPNEPHAPKVKPTVDGRYTEKAVEGAMKRMGLHGRVFDWWKKLNPEALPAIGFGCSVETSLGWAKDFYKRGVTAAHIDGNDIWINGEYYFADSEARAQVLAESRTGGVKVVWNRYVMREGIDCPWFYHGILATIFGSISAYLQSVGRLLRNFPCYDHVILQDHGGNWWRHGSPNSDRVWELGDSSRVLHMRRERRLREKKEAEPMVCPKCQALREWGRECPQCGHVSRRRARYLVQTDGSLVETQGDIFKPRRLADKKPSNIAAWERCYWRAYKSRNHMTFLQAEALFARENGWRWPQEDFPLMPQRELDWFERVCDVPMHRLTSKGKDQQHAIALDI